MSDEHAEFIGRIVIDYDPISGKFGLQSNVTGDEVLATGMLETAKSKMQEQRQIARLKELQAEQEKAIIKVR